MENTIAQDAKFPEQQPETQPDNQDVTLIEINEELRFLLSPRYVQIDAPQRIEAELLQPFLYPIHTWRKEILLVTNRNRQITPAILKAIQEGFLTVFTPQAVKFHGHQGKPLLVVFPVLPKQHYVLQTMIENLYFDHLRLRYLDPRADARRQVQLATPVLLRLVPPAVITALEYQQIRIVREMLLPLKEKPSIPEGHIADLFYQRDSLVRSPYMELFEEATPFSCGLHDISRGGVCLTLDGDRQSAEFLNHLVMIYISLPPGPLHPNDTVQDYKPCTLRLLGVIRGVRSTVQPWTLHIRFLKRLPEECDILFTYLERQRLTE